MKYFLTGGTGFIGGRLARQLVQGGHQVVAVVRDPDKAPDLAELGVTLFRGDVTDKESLRRPMSGVDGVFHIAGWYKVGVRDKRPGQLINVTGTRNVLELMQELGIAKGVYTSTLAINSDTRGRLVDESYRYHGPHVSEYDRTKWAAHYEVAEPMISAGLPLVIVMPGATYGPGDTSMVHTLLTQYLQRRLPVIPQQSAYCLAHVEDIARAHWLAMEKGVPGETYIIAGPRYTLVEIMKIAEEITGIPASPALPPRIFKAMAVLAGLLEKVLPLPESYTGEGLRTIAGVTYTGDNSKARRELGYKPRPLIEGLRETIAYEMKLLGR